MLPKPPSAPKAPKPRRPRTRLPAQPIRRPTFARGPRGLAQPLGVSVRPPQVFPDPPAWWTARYPAGTRPEWAVYWALMRLGKREGVEGGFDYQSAKFGGRTILGGTVVDFLMLDGSGIAINVQGLYWHYERPEAAVVDPDLRIQLLQQGIHLIWIDEDHATGNPVYYVSEALRGVDWSRRGLGDAF